jgi:hypothetical protein
MSFFDDEDDDPPPNPRQASSRPRPASRRRPTGAGEHQQQVQTRRIVAVVGLVVIIVVIALLVHGCSVSANKSSLETYSSNVYTLIGDSDANGKKLFSDLASANTVGATGLQTELYGLHATAQNQLKQAEKLSVPGSMSKAQTYVVFTLQQRADGLHQIASNIQSAVGTSNGEDGVRKIAQGMAYLYASDVTYKGYAAPAIASGLHGSSLDVSSTTINPGQIMTDLGWVQQKFIANKIGAKLPSKEVNAPPVAGGLYGHTLNSVSVGGTTLVPGATNTLAASPAPTFVLSVTNGGNYNEYDVTCKVSIKGLNDSATSTIAETTAGGTTTCSVQLPKPPSTGTWDVIAQVEKVPGEKNLANNKLTFPVDFTG